MRFYRVGIVVAALTLAAARAAAGVIVNADTQTSFTGTFSIQGQSSWLVDPVNFSLLPGYVADSLGFRRDSDLQLYSNSGGGFFHESILLGAQSFSPRAGSYAVVGETVDWTYFNLADTGGSSGAFTGAFSFVARPTTSAAPDGGTTAVLLGIAFTIISAVRRRCV